MSMLIVAAALSLWDETGFCDYSLRPHITHWNETCEIHAGNIDGGKGCWVSHSRIVRFAAY